MVNFGENMNDFFSLLSIVKFRPARLAPSVWSGHIPFAAWIISTLRPNIFVELGTRSGNSYLAFCQSVAEHGLSTKCYAVDTWQGDEHAGFYDESVFNELNEYHQIHYARFSCLLRMTFDEAVAYFSDGSIDLLHIDGLHTYEAVKHDFETWLPKLSPHAVVLFHDINVRERGFGVWRFWEELCERYPLHFEFVHSKGLGILQLSSERTSFSLDWLMQDAPNRNEIRDFFSGLGEHIQGQFDLQILQGRFRESEAKILDINSRLAACNAELEEIRRSRAWQFAMWLRRIRHYLAPLGSMQSSLGKALISYFRHPFTFGRGRKT
jgi:O-antigen biosynthesis protein